MGRTVAQISCLWEHRASCLVSGNCNRQATPVLRRLHNSVAQHRVFSRKQLLCEFIAAFVHVALRAREMSIDAQAGGATEIIGDGNDLEDCR